MVIVNKLSYVMKTNVSRAARLTLSYSAYTAPPFRRATSLVGGNTSVRSPNVNICTKSIALRKKNLAQHRKPYAPSRGVRSEVSEEDS